MLRKKIIIDLIFLTPLVVGLTCINVYTLSERSVIDAYKRIYKTRHLSSKVQSVIIGTSHTNDAFFGSDLPNNIEMIGVSARQNIMLAYLQVKYLLDKGYNLQYLFLEDDPNLFIPRRGEDKEMMDVSLTLGNVKDINLLFDSNYSYIDKISAKFPVLRGDVRTTLFEHFILGDGETMKSAHFDDLPWEKRTSEQRMEAAKKRAETFFYPEITNQKTIEAFIKLMKLCKDNNVKVVGVRYPVSQEYHKERLAVDLKEVDLVKREYPFDEIWDFQGLYEGKKEYFKNADHIKADKAYIFQNEFRSRYQSLLNAD